MNIRSLQPQFILQGSQAGDAAQDRQRSRDSGRDHDRDSHDSKEDSKREGKKLASRSPNLEETHANEHEVEISRDTHALHSTKPLITTSDLAAALTLALSPENLLPDANAGEASQDRKSKGSNSHGPSKNSSGPKGKGDAETDPVAAVLRRLAFQTAEDSFRKLQALSAYAKVRDALKEPELPNLKLIAEAMAAEAKGEAPNHVAASLSENKNDLLKTLDQELAALKSPSVKSNAPSPVGGGESGDALLDSELDPEAQALIALKAFQHIDLAA